MAAPPAARVVGRLEEIYGYPIVEQIGRNLTTSTPAALFGLLCVGVLAHPRVPGWKAMAASRALAEEGWSTAERLAASPWKARVDALSRAGYTRSPERAAFTMGHLADGVRDDYDGDLGNLRAAAGGDPTAERALLKELKGVDDKVVDVFFREAQTVWHELYPYADGRVIRAARRLGLPADAQSLAALVGPERFPRLAAGLAHVDRAGAYDTLLEENEKTIDLREAARSIARRMF